MKKGEEQENVWIKVKIETKDRNIVTGIWYKGKLIKKGKRSYWLYAKEAYSRAGALV